MFIRKVRTRSRKAGGHYTSFRLARSVRTSRGVRQVHLLNLGADFPVPEPLWPRFVQLVEDEPLVPADPQLLAP